MDGMVNTVTKHVLDTVSTTLHVTRGLVCVTGVVLLDGVDTNVKKVRY